MFFIRTIYYSYHLTSFDRVQKKKKKKKNDRLVKNSKFKI